MCSLSAYTRKHQKSQLIVCFVLIHKHYLCPRRYMSFSINRWTLIIFNWNLVVAFFTLTMAVYPFALARAWLHGGHKNFCSHFPGSALVVLSRNRAPQLEQKYEKHHSHTKLSSEPRICVMWYPNMNPVAFNSWKSPHITHCFMVYKRARNAQLLKHYKQKNIDNTFLHSNRSIITT